METYRTACGDDYFRFWAGGSLCVVINSMLWAAQEPDAERRYGAGRKDLREARRLAEAQDEWLRSVLLQGLSVSSEESARAGADDAAPPLLIFSHISPFCYSA